MTTFSFLRVQATILVGVFLSWSVLAEADIFDVNITANVTPIDPTGTLFGQTETSLATVSFRLDTSALIFIPAGTQIGPFVADIIATDLYGYQKTALSAISASYGNKTWNEEDVNDRPLGGYGPNPSAAIWFNGPVMVGGSAIPNIVFEDNDGLLVTAPLACGLNEVGGGCKLLDRLDMFDQNSSNMGISGSLAITVSVTSTAIEVGIDIKPGSYPNSINLGSSGVIPVAILSSPTFDATTVNPDSVTLAGAKVRLVGKANKYLCQSEDVNGDGRVDLMCHVETEQLLLQLGDSQAMLEATTYDGKQIHGIDTISIVSGT